MRHQGIVFWFDIDMGFGVISKIPSEDKVFFNSSALEMDDSEFPRQGEKVEFEFCEDSNGSEAVRVKKIK